jgi:hypothetical protein
MQAGCKYLLCCSLLCLFSTIAFAKEMTCPPLELIQRTPGQNGWNALPPGWEGRFDSPQLGQGYSTKVIRFDTVRWVKLNNLPDGPGKIECDYDGNFDSEVIRFDQASYFSTKHPEGDMWNCKIGGDFPSAICECSIGIDYCSFDSDAHEINTALDFEDNLRSLDQEFIK